MSNLFQQNQEKLSEEISRQSPMSVQQCIEQTKRLLENTEEDQATDPSINRSPARE